MPEQIEMLTESPEEKSFFDSKGAPPAAAPEPVVTPPVATPTPEPVAAPAPTPAPEPQPKTVPLATMLEERRRFEARINALEAKIAPPAPTPPPPNPEEDPIAAIRRNDERLAAFEKQQAEQAEVAAIADFGARHAAEFRKEHADFDQAYQHIRTARANQLMEQGLVNTPQELNQRIYAEEREIITMAAKMNVSPAALMYNLALSAGYTPAQAAAAVEAAPEPAAAQPAPVSPVAPPTPSVPDKLKMAADGQARATSSAKAPSGAGGPLDLRAVAMLANDEWDKATEGDNWKKLWN